MPGGITTEVKTYQMYVNGEWVASKSAKTFPVYDPSTEEVIAQVPDAGSDDVDRAVAAAKAAFEDGPWASTTAQERGRVLFRLADRIRQNLPALAELECRNTGKPIVEAEFDIGDAATCFEYYGGLATKVVGQVNPVPDNAMSLTLKEPIGIAGQIIPWNYPLLMAAWKLAPAIAAGCTCVLKPAEQTPLTALAFANYFEEAGLPPGVINCVNGLGEVVGTELTNSPDIAKIAFTGSTQIGKLVAKSALDTMKRLTLELGGKSANIILDDADFAKAIPMAVNACYLNNGQACIAGSRLFIPEDRLDEVKQLVKAAVAKVKVGDPNDSDVTMGPLVSQKQYQRVQSYIRSGIEEGAEVVIGGEGHPEGLERGNFVKPTVFANVKPEMKIAREEIFGPVLSILTYKIEADAIRMANDSEFGLMAYVSSSNPERASRVARQLQAGRVLINTLNHDPLTPFGGYKQSGIGREGGVYGLKEFLEPKAIILG